MLVFMGQLVATSLEIAINNPYSPRIAETVCYYMPIEETDGEIPRGVLGNYRLRTRPHLYDENGKQWALAVSSDGTLSAVEARNIK